MPVRETKSSWNPVLCWEGSLRGERPDGGWNVYPARVVEVSQGGYVLEMAFNNDAMGKPVWSATKMLQQRV